LKRWWSRNAERQTIFAAGVLVGGAAFALGVAVWLAVAVTSVTLIGCYLLFARLTGGST
jgi:hypothetical protein